MQIKIHTQTRNDFLSLPFADLRTQNSTETSEQGRKLQSLLASLGYLETESVPSKIQELVFCNYPFQEEGCLWLLGGMPSEKKGTLSQTPFYGMDLTGEEPVFFCHDAPEPSNTYKEKLLVKAVRPHLPRRHFPAGCR